MVIDPSLSLSLPLSLPPLQKQPLLFPVADVLQLLSKVMAYGDATLKDVKIKVCDAKLRDVFEHESEYLQIIHNFEAIFLLL